MQMLLQMLTQTLNLNSTNPKHPHVGILPVAFTCYIYTP